MATRVVVSERFSSRALHLLRAERAFRSSRRLDETREPAFVRDRAMKLSCICGEVTDVVSLVHSSSCFCRLLQRFFGSVRAQVEYSEGDACKKTHRKGRLADEFAP